MYYICIVIQHSSTGMIEADFDANNKRCHLLRLVRHFLQFSCILISMTFVPLRVATTKKSKCPPAEIPTHAIVPIFFSALLPSLNQDHSRSFKILSSVKSNKLLSSASRPHHSFIQPFGTDYHPKVSSA